MTAFVQSLPAVLVTVVVAVLTAFGLVWLSFPLPWMLGPLFATAVLSFIDVRIGGRRAGLPKASRNYFVPIIGLMLGARVAPGFLADVAVWWPSLLLLLPYMVAAQLINALVLEKLGGYDRPTAFFGASPGGLIDAVLIGEQKGGNAPLMAVQHVSRVSLSVFALSVLMYLGWGAAPGAITGAITGAGAVATLTPLDVLVLGLAAIAGVRVARLLRFPAASLVGPFLFSAVLHGTGISAAQVPVPVLNLAQLVVGITLGMGFFGPTRAQMVKGMGLSVVTVSISLALALGVAWVTSAFGLAPFQIEFLAFAPGGLAEMGLMALLWNADPTFVTTHHVLRIGLSIAVAPALYHWVQRWRGPGSTR